MYRIEPRWKCSDSIHKRGFFGMFMNRADREDRNNSEFDIWVDLSYTPEPSQGKIELAVDGKKLFYKISGYDDYQIIKAIMEYNFDRDLTETFTK